MQEALENLKYESKKKILSRKNDSSIQKTPQRPFFSNRISIVSAISKRSSNELHSIINFSMAGILEAEETTFAKLHFPSGPKNREQDQQVQI